MNVLLDPKIKGFLVFCFKELREVALIELRNGFKKQYDIVLDFYLNRMDNSVYSRNIDLKKFDRIRKIARAYCEYEIHYSFSAPEEQKTFLENQSFQYFLISEVDNVIRSYHQVRQDFYEKSRSGNFCRKKHIQDLIEVYRENSRVLEYGMIG